MASSSAGVFKRLLAHWVVKLCLGAALTIVFCSGYFALAYHPMRPPASLPLTRIDWLVSFSPSWVWVYQSIYLLLGVAWMSETLDQLRRYAIGFAILMAVGFTCFMVWPVTGPRPPEISTDVMYRVLVRYDTTLNCFPSLHIALATYSACIGVAVTSGRTRRVLMVFLPAWVALIGYSTLATRQHYLVDLPPGILLGWLAQLAAWRYRAPSMKVAGLAEEGVD